MIEHDLSKESATIALFKMVETFTFSNKRKLTEFEKVLIISGAAAHTTMLKTIADQTNSKENFRAVRFKIEDDIRDYMTKGPGSDVHDFYCEGCAIHSEKPKEKQ